MAAANTTQTHKISFMLSDISTYNVLGFGSTPSVYNYEVVPAGMGKPIPVFVAENPQFWIEPNSDGYQQLCTSKKIEAGPIFGMFQPVGTGLIHTRVGQVFEVITLEDGTTKNMPKSNS